MFASIHIPLVRFRSWLNLIFLSFVATIATNQAWAQNGPLPFLAAAEAGPWYTPNDVGSVFVHWNVNPHHTYLVTATGVNSPQDVKSVQWPGPSQNGNAINTLPFSSNFPIVWPMDIHDTNVGQVVFYFGSTDLITFTVVDIAPDGTRTNLPYAPTAIVTSGPVTGAGLPSSVTASDLTGGWNNIIDWAGEPSNYYINGLKTSSAFGYNIYRDDDNGTGPYIIYQTLNLTQSQWIDTAPGMTESYFVTEFWRETEDLPTAGISCTECLPAAQPGEIPPIVTDALAPMHAPSGTWATRVIQGAGLVLNWSPVLGANGYNIYRSTTNTLQNPDSLIGAVNGTAFTDASIALNTTYSYWVAAENGTGVSPPSAPFFVTIAGAAPSGVSNLVADTWVNPNAVTLYWTGSSASYNIFRNGILLANTSNSSYVDNTASGPTNIYTVYSVNSGNLSAQYSSNAVNAVPGAAIPPNITTLTINYISSQNQNLPTWQSLGNGYTYNVYYWTATPTSATSPQYINIPAAAAGTWLYYYSGSNAPTQYYSVTAVNSNGEGELSTGVISTQGYLNGSFSVTKH